MNETVNEALSRVTHCSLLFSFKADPVFKVEMVASLKLSLLKLCYKK